MELYIPPIIKLKAIACKKGKYTAEENRIIAELFPTTKNVVIAIKLGRTVGAVSQHARKMGLKKPVTFFKDTALSGRLHPGNKPWNKGSKGICIGGISTQFKSGSIPFNHKPVGSERISVDGYTEIKIAEPNIYRLKHRVEWEKLNGVLPANLILVCRTKDRSNSDPSNWEPITRAEHAKRNHNRIKAASTLKETWRKERLRVEKLGLAPKTKLFNRQLKKS